MNLQHLRYFLAVARNGGFTQAAREMHVTQPTVSSGVADLERHLGVQLFNRDSRHVALTTEGRLLMGYAVQIEDLLEEAGERLERRDLEPGEGFQFGAIDAAVIYLLPEILKEYMRSYPGVALKTQVAPSRYLVEDLLMNRSEFALIHLPYSHPKIDTVPIYRDEMPLVVGTDHRFTHCREVELNEVVEEPLILFHADSVSRKVVDEKLAEAGLALGATMELRSPEAMRKPAARRPLRSRLSGRSSTGRSASWVIRTWSASLRPVRRIGVSNQAESTRTLTRGWTGWATNRTERLESTRAAVEETNV